MLRKTLLLFVITSSFAFGQEIDVKDTIKYFVKDSDSTLQGYSRNQSNAIEKLLNHKFFYPESNPEIITQGFIKVDVNYVENDINYSSPFLSEVNLKSGVYRVRVQQNDVKKTPNYYEVNINDEIFLTRVNINEEFSVDIDPSQVRTIQINPVYKPLENKFISNQLKINNQ